MRLKEEAKNYTANGIKRRDFRHDSSQPLHLPRHQTKKNKNKWCKGRVGVEHEYESRVPPNDSFAFRKMDICKNCSRQSYTNTKYYCRHHDLWDEHVYWNTKHTHIVK